MANQDWRGELDERQVKEIAFAELYAKDFAHGTTGHNQLILIARLAELLDIATGAKAPPAPVEPADVVLTFGKYAGYKLGELSDFGYLEWLSREAREPALRKAAAAVVAGQASAHTDGPDF